MLTSFIISIREFLEAFLIIGVFFGINKRLNLKKEKEIFLAVFLGILICLILPILTFYFSHQASKILTEKNTELLEGYLMIFSGFFLTYVVFSLHQTIHKLTNKNILFAHKKMEKKIFDISLFLLIVFFIIREGFEIALFTASTSLFSSFTENLIGLILGFAISSVIGILTYFSYIKFSIKKIYQITEWFIIFLGGSMIINGLNEFLEIYFHQKFSNFLPIKIEFLPSSSTFLGHLLKSFFAIQKDFSFLVLIIMILYVFFIKKILLKNQNNSKNDKI
ncbi:MAG: FTR1 family protein [Patescibacteria group bacterium]|nr:FTR1 family protein [Patescibacteria group bacterium]